MPLPALAALQRRGPPGASRRLPRMHTRDDARDPASCKSGTLLTWPHDGAVS